MALPVPATGEPVLVTFRLNVYVVPTSEPLRPTVTPASLHPVPPVTLKEAGVLQAAKLETVSSMLFPDVESVATPPPEANVTVELKLPTGAALPATSV